MDRIIIKREFTDRCQMSDFTDPETGFLFDPCISKAFWALVMVDIKDEDFCISHSCHAHLTAQINLTLDVGNAKEA
jgi:hypothetical protein